MYKSIKLLSMLSILSVFGGVSIAQTPQHSVTLTWTDTANPQGTTYSIYRSQGLCSGTPTFSKIASAVTVKTYKDDTVQPGNYCYEATATFNGMESAPSPTALAPVPSWAPTQLSVTIQ